MDQIIEVNEAICEGRPAGGAAGEDPEVEMAVVFTQDTVDDNGYPVRDRTSSRYIAAFEPAAAFQKLVKAEWLAARLAGLDYGYIDGIEKAVRKYPLEGVKKDEAEKDLGYFLKTPRGCATSSYPPVTRKSNVHPWTYAESSAHAAGRAVRVAGLPGRSGLRRAANGRRHVLADGSVRSRVRREGTSGCDLGAYWR